MQDETPSLVALRPSADLRSWSVAQTIAVTADGPLDLEGVAVLDDGFVVASEEGARVLELDARGVVRREHAVPQAFRSARANKGLESLALSPDGRALFTTSESALAEDGPVATARAGTLVRLLRIDRATGAATEHGYLTDAAVGDGCDHGVSDLAALSPSELLVLERGFCEGRGNRVRVYRVSLGEVPMKMRDGSTSSSRSGGELEALAKSLVVDLAALERPEAPLLANYEGIALGPPLPDGKASLLLVSDDNGHDAQAARVLVLALG